MNSFKIFILACLICVGTINAMAQDLGVDNLASLGDFYSRSNDISDAADRYYKQAIRSAPGSHAAGIAQFNRGSYWFRKFYVVREQYSKEDPRALNEAEGQYYDFIDKFAKQTKTIELLSDAEFYLALVYLQQGKRNYAIGWLNQMLKEAVKQDRSVYIYQVVWSSKPGDIVDRNVDAADLAKFARQVIERESDVNSIVLEIKRWCQRQ